MEKIVIISDRPEEDGSLVTCLSVLFPECEIQVFSGQTKGSGYATEVQGPETQKVTKF